MKPWKMDDGCRRASDFRLSSEQARALDSLQQAYSRETRLIRAELLLRRLELREALTSPASKSETIRSKYLELNDLQNRLEEKILDFLIKVRGLLAPEQLKNWCPEEEIPLFRRLMQGVDPGGHRPPRRPPVPGEDRED